VSVPVREYLVDAVEATRNDPDILLGASPRATLFLQRAARTLAAIAGRNYTTPDDVKAMLRPVLTHRLILRPEAQMRGTIVSQVVDGIAATIAIPGSGARV
jgi:MoxR-like ATPase